MKDTAIQIIDAVGGLENVKSATHCMTRLRLELVDKDLFNEQEVLNVEKVKGVNIQGEQFQIILGTGVVDKVFKEVDQLFTASGKENEVKQTGNIFQRASRLLGDIFIPILPVIVASGVLMGLRSYLLQAGYLTNDSSWFTVLAVLIDTSFSFLPAIVTWSAVKRFGGSPVLGIVLGLMLISPLLPAAPAVARGNAEALQVPIFGFNIAVTGYQGSVLAGVSAGWLVSYFEKMLKKVIPNVVDMILTPLISLSLAYFIVLIAVGPVLNAFESALVSVVSALFTLPFGIGAFIVGALQQPLVITGLHHSLLIIDINLLEETGVNMYQPIRNAAILGQAGAAFGFAIMSRHKKMRATAAAATVSGVFGITEPAIFGVNLVYGLPFVFGMLGSGLGAMFARIMGLAAPGMGASGIPSLLYFIGTPEMIPYVISSLIAFGLPCILSIIYINRKKGI